MKLSRRANTIILWVVSIGLLLGMVITFTPSLGLGLGGSGDTSAVALRVNGEPIRELQVAQTASNPLFLAVTEGEVGEDLDLLLVDTLIRQEVVRQAAARVRVSDGDVRAAVDDFRASRGFEGRANDNAYLSLLSSAGFTDQTFRAYLREQLRQQRWEEEALAGVDVNDDEARAYFESHRDDYLSEERIEARLIVTETQDAADTVLARLIAGEDAGLVARESSLDRADRDGALGAAAGETEPRPVGRPALPTAVANAAFALRGSGVTDAIEADGRFHVVVVEGYLPAERRPFDEVAATVREDALAAKQSGALEQTVEDLVAAARIEIPADSTLQVEDTTVARVGGTEIMRSDLVRATYTNPQIQQALSPDTAVLISAFFKPAILSQLVDQELAVQGAADLGVPFVGPRSVVAQSALSYVARDAEATDEAVAAYYAENQDQYAVPASAVVARVDLPSPEAATAYREQLLAGADYVDAAGELGGGVEELGTVRPGQLEDVLDTTLFATDAFTSLPGSPWAVSDVLVLAETPAVLPEAIDTTGETETAVDAAGDASDDAPADDAGDTATAPAERYVVLVAERTPERVRGLDEVRDLVASTVLAQARADLRNAWLDELRTRIEVVDSFQPDAGSFVTDEAAADEAATDEAAADEAATDEAAGDGAAGGGDDEDAGAAQQ